MFLTFLLQGGDVAHPDAARHFTEQRHRVRNVDFLSSSSRFLTWRIGATYSSAHETTPFVNDCGWRVRISSSTFTPCQSCLFLDLFRCVSVHTPVIRHTTRVCAVVLRATRLKMTRQLRKKKPQTLSWSLKMWHGTFCPQSNVFPCFPGWSTRIRTMQKTLCSRQFSCLEPSESFSSLNSINLQTSNTLSAALTPTSVCCFSRMPNKVLKPGDWERGNREPWRPQLGFNPNRQQAHLDQSGFRALG